MEFFQRLDKGVQSLTAWVALFTVLTAAFTWLAKQLKALGAIGWPEAIFVAIGAAAVVVITISIGMLAWRAFRPLSAEATGTDNAKPTSPSEMAQLDRQIGDLISIVGRHQTDLKAVQEWYPELLKQIQRVSAENEGSHPEFARGLSSHSREISQLDLSTTHLVKEVVANGRVLRALCRIRLFRAFRADLDRWEAQETAYWQDLSVVFFLDGALYSDDKWQRGYEVTRRGWEQWLSGLRGLWADAFSGECDLLAHPNYDRNSQRPVQNDEKIGDPAIKQEWRRAFDQKHTVSQFVTAFRESIASEIEQAEAAVFSYAMQDAVSRPAEAK